MSLVSSFGVTIVLTKTGCNQSILCFCCVLVIIDRKGQRFCKRWREVKKLLKSFLFFLASWLLFSLLYWFKSSLIYIFFPHNGEHEPQSLFKHIHFSFTTFVCKPAWLSNVMSFIIFFFPYWNCNVTRLTSTTYYSRYFLWPCMKLTGQYWTSVVPFQCFTGLILWRQHGIGAYASTPFSRSWFQNFWFFSLFFIILNCLWHVKTKHTSAKIFPKTADLGNKDVLSVAWLASIRHQSCPLCSISGCGSQ